MGAVIACAACIDGDIPVEGMVLTGAALLPGSSVSPVLVRAAAILGRLFPRAPVVRFDLTAISRDEEVVRRAILDPLSDHGPSPARTGYELLRASRRVLDRAADIRPRLLILHGGNDRLADPNGSIRLHEGTKGAGSQLTVYPGLYHEVLNEPEGRRVLEDVLRWLDEHARD
jgi:alpha-beta hydrolase superfamily lysophospholipase